METLDYNRLLLVSLWQYNHHGDEGLTLHFSKKRSERSMEVTATKNGPATSIRISGT